MNKLDRHLKALELDKVLERLAGYTACEDARETALSLRPAKSEDEQCAENAGAQAALYDILFNVHAVSVLQRKTEPAAQFL